MRRASSARVPLLLLSPRSSSAIRRDVRRHRRRSVRPPVGPNVRWWPLGGARYDVIGTKSGGDGGGGAGSHLLRRSTEGLIAYRHLREQRRRFWLTVRLSVSCGTVAVPTSASGECNRKQSNGAWLRRPDGRKKRPDCEIVAWKQEAFDGCRMHASRSRLSQSNSPNHVEWTEHWTEEYGIDVKGAERSLQMHTWSPSTWLKNAFRLTIRISTEPAELQLAYLCHPAAVTSIRIHSLVVQHSNSPSVGRRDGSGLQQQKVESTARMIPIVWRLLSLWCLEF